MRHYYLQLGEDPLYSKVSIGLIRYGWLYTRLALILAGAFGAYSLGANNIANVMGVFVPVAPFMDIAGWSSIFRISSSTTTFFSWVGLAIAVGVFTYSKRVMMTVGSELITLTPLAAWVAVMAHSIVLFHFCLRKRLEQFLANLSLPTIPLVPVSSSQAVVGAVIGIGIVAGRKRTTMATYLQYCQGLGNHSCIISLLTLYRRTLFSAKCFPARQLKRESQYQLSTQVYLSSFRKAGIETTDELDHTDSDSVFSQFCRGSTGQ